MTIATTITAIQTANAAIAGIVSTPDGTTDPMPSQVDTASMPLVLVWPGRLDMAAAGRDLVEATRRYEGAVLLAGEASGVGIATNTALIWDALDAFRSAWMAYVAESADLGGGVVATRYTDSGDTGGFVTYRGKRWAGFTFALDVWEPV